MSRRMRREILIETEEVWLVRRRRSHDAWCPACAEQVPHLTAAEGARVSGKGPEEVRHGLEAGLLHFAETIDGPLICLNSILNWK